jgi:otoferlin
MNARDLLYSTTDEETGVHCGKMQTVFFKLPGKQQAGPAGWQIRAKLTIYAWLGVVKHKKFFFSGLPRGFELSQDLRNAERPRALAPTNIHYLEKHVNFIDFFKAFVTCFSFYFVL